MGTQNPLSDLEISPQLASLPPGGTATFLAIAQGALATGVEWTVSAGSITSAGFFTAPAQPGSYQVQARYGGVTGLAIADVVAPGAPGALYAAASSTCAAMPVRATGVTRYFCDCASGAQAGCVAGSDANAGTSPGAPKQTLSALLTAFNAMNAGDTVALCKGGAWSTAANYDFYNSRCSPAANMRTAANTTTCDIRDYAPGWGGTAKPILRQTSGVVALFRLDSAAMRGVRILNLDFEGGGTGPGGATVGQRALFLDESDSDFLICNNTMNGWYLGLHNNYSGTTTSNGLDVWGNRFTMNSLDAILGAGSNSTFDANFFDNNGSNNATSHTVYLNGQNTTNFSFVNNEIRRSGAPTTCQGTMLVVHDQFDGLNIENNLIDGGAGASGGCWAIGVVSGGYPRSTWARNLAIRRNFISNTGWGIIVSVAPGPIIENNIVVSGLAGSRAIMVPYEAHRTSPLDDTTTAAVIRNNTLYFRATAASSIGIDVETEGSGYVIANNAINFAGGSGTCFVTGLAAGAYSFVGNNACNGSWGTSYDATTHVTANPGFVGPPTDFTPATGSPLIGNGAAAQAPAYDFSLRPRTNPVSIGALEP